MKLVCKISGVDFTCEHFWKDTQVVDIHPIFRLPNRELLNKAGQWGRGEFSEIEEKLLFLALLNNTGSVKFSSYADPRPLTVATNMEALFMLSTWLENTVKEKLVLPIYRVSEETYQLENIGRWIKELYECRAEWMQPSIRKHLQDDLASKERILDRLIHSANKNSPYYAGRLANWAMVTANVPEALISHWTELFKLKEPEIYSASLADLDELREHMETNLTLPGYHSMGHAQDYTRRVLEHVRWLFQTRKDGQLASLTGGHTYTWIEGDSYSRERAEKIDVEERNKRIIAAKAPETEPREIDFPGKKLDFIRAKAAWRIAQSLKEEV